MCTWDVFCAACGVDADGSNIYFSPSKGLAASSEHPPDPKCYEEDYDRRIIRSSDFRWCKNSRILGSPVDENSNKPVPPAFICGNCYFENGSARLYVGPPYVEKDPNFPGSNSCYDSDKGAVRIFPFHRSCLKMLAWVLTGEARIECLDLDRLYSTLYWFPQSRSALDLDYGVPSHTKGPVWICKPGWEHLVTDPLTVNRYKIRDYIRETITAVGEGGFDLVLGGREEAGLDARVRSDAFRTLPPELLMKIFDYLPVESLGTLATASWHVHAFLRSNARFWKAYAGRKFPWFTEFLELFDQENASVLAGKAFTKVCLWADTISVSKEGLKGRRMWIANRRRIWGACEQIAPHYAAADP